MKSILWRSTLFLHVHKFLECKEVNAGFGSRDAVVSATLSTFGLGTFSNTVVFDSFCFFNDMKLFCFPPPPQSSGSPLAVSTKYTVIILQHLRGCDLV